MSDAEPPSGGSAVSGDCFGASMSNTNIIPQGLFGPGILILTRTDLANQTPYNVGFVNEFSYDFGFDTKQPVANNAHKGR